MSSNMKNNPYTMPSLSFGDMWQIVDADGCSILFRTYKDRYGKIDFFCKELQRHGFMSGIISCKRVYTYEQELEDYRKEEEKSEKGSPV